jgi:tetratricopeptide (TPR) repeat protein
MPPQATDPKVTGVEPLGNRLDCWKEIADYLGRGERTAKRWETERGLPTHRAPGAGRSGVYAFTAELDEWLKAGKAQRLENAHEEQEEIKSMESPVPALAEPKDSAAAAPRAQQAPAATPGLKKRNWRLAVAGFLATAIVIASGYAGAPRPAGAWIFNGIPALFAKSQPKPDLKVAPVVSDSEKSLAHEFYLKGRYEWNQRTPDSLNRALDSFTQAVVHNPGDAQAYVGLADTYNLLEEYSAMPDNYAYPRAIAAAKKAVELDDSLGEAHRTLAYTEWWGEWDFVDSEKEFRRAIELNPKDPATHKWYANTIAEEGRFEESLKEIDRAQELDPSSHTILADKGLMMFNAGRQREGIELLKEVERSAPEFRSPHFYLMTIGLESRNYQQFLAEGKMAAESVNDPVLRDVIAAAHAGYVRDGERGLLNGLYAKQKQYYLAGKLWGTVLAKTCIAMGRKQEALQLLEQAYNHHEGYVLSCWTEPDLLTLKDEPRYKALVQRINFPQASQKAQPSIPPEEPHSPLRASSEPPRNDPSK